MAHTGTKGSKGVALISHSTDRHTCRHCDRDVPEALVRIRVYVCYRCRSRKRRHGSPRAKTCPRCGDVWEEEYVGETDGIDYCDTCLVEIF